MGTVRAIVMSIWLIVVGCFVCHGTANATPCQDTYTYGVGGFTSFTSALFAPYVNQTISYPAVPTADAAQAGVNEINRLFNERRTQCPNEHAKVIGHSEGAAVVHTWVTQFGPADTNVILLSDPKRKAGPGGPGLAALGSFMGYPLGGVDDAFGNVRVLSVCNGDDWVCNIDAGPVGYAFTDTHTSRYDFNVNNYSDDAQGVWFR